MARNIRKRPGPKPTGKGTPVVVRMKGPLLAALDKFAAEQDGKPSRPETVRLILNDFLIGYGLLPLEVPPPIKQDAN